MNDVLALAFDSLNWIELKKNRASAVGRSAKLLVVKDQKTITQAYFLVKNVLQRKNYIDRVLSLACAPSALKDFSLSSQSFLRIFVFKAKFESTNLTELIELTKVSRLILGWKNLMPLEEFLGQILKIIDSNDVVSGLTDIDKISFQTFYPQWFVKYCFHLLGRCRALKLLNFNVSPNQYIKINTFKEKEEVIFKEISCPGVILQKIEAIPFLYKVICGAKLLAGLESYVNGLFSFQDFPSSLAVVFASPRPGDVIIDVGIHPVSKTIYLAQLMKNSGKIFSIDFSAHRLKMLISKVKRANVGIVEPIIPEKIGHASSINQADVVLLSPPCSNTGVFWREPSLKWKTDFNRVKDLCNIQWNLINKYANYVKDGGNLVYWTSSITLEENELMLEQFLKLHPEFSFSETYPRIGTPGLRGQKECQRLYPHLFAVDGSYFARLIKHEK
ncbi:MAG: RsmB/NOP family class I SAM-dependent RNA methyltransferase [Candidatus Bathyarchaeota archaeon]